LNVEKKALLKVFFSLPPKVAVFSQFLPKITLGALGVNKA